MKSRYNTDRYIEHIKSVRRIEKEIAELERQRENIYDRLQELKEDGVDMQYIVLCDAEGLI